MQLYSLVGRGQFAVGSFVIQHQVVGSNHSYVLNRSAKSFVQCDDVCSSQVYTDVFLHVSMSLKNVFAMG